MGSDEEKQIPYGNIRDSAQIGAAVRAKRKAMELTQADAAALCNVGNRFFSELERGKPSCEMGKVLRVLQNLGIDVVLQPRGAAR